MRSKDKNFKLLLVVFYIWSEIWTLDYNFVTNLAMDSS